MAEHDVIVQRVRKLLALGDGNASAAEATSAVLLAQRLIVKYGIADDELSADNPDAGSIAAIETEPLADARAWRWQLANLVASSFRCKVWQRDHFSYRSGSDRRFNRPTFAFYGYEQDAQAARLAFGYLYRTGSRLASAQVRQLRRSGRSTNGAYNSYVTGFLAGLRTELEKQSKELMVVLPLEVRERYESEVASTLTFSTDRKLSCDYRRKGLIERGMRDGRDAVRSRRLDDAHDLALCAEG